MKVPLPSMSLLKKIQVGGINDIKAIKTLRERKEIYNDIVLMVDGNVPSKSYAVSRWCICWYR